MNQLNEIFWYHPLTGKLFWKVSTARSVKKGDIAGCINGKGYRIVQIDGKLYRVHRIIWEMFNGSIPDGIEIDHINNIKDYNRIDNLRLATHNKNQHNRKLNNNNTSGVKGVNFHSQAGLWEGRVAKNKITYRKRFPTKELAEQWVRNKREELHGEYHHHG